MSFRPQSGRLPTAEPFRRALARGWRVARLRLERRRRGPTGVGYDAAGYWLGSNVIAQPHFRVAMGCRFFLPQ